MAARDETINGSDLTGNDGESNRTYTLAFSDAISTGMRVFINGTYLFRGDGRDYTFSNQVITFLNIVDDTDLINIQYSTGTSTDDPTYCSDVDVKKYLGLSYSFSASTNPTLTEVNEMIVEAEDEVNLLTGHSWKSLTVNSEYYDFPVNYGPYNRGYEYGLGIPLFLRHRSVKTFDSDEGDKLEVWNGSSYEDWLSVKTEGRGNDFWVDYVKGIVYFKTFYRYHIQQAVRVNYRYGEGSVPSDITKLTALMVAIRLMSQDDHSVMMSETGDPTRMPYQGRIDKMQKEIDRIVQNRTEIVII